MQKKVKLNDVTTAFCVNKFPLMTAKAYSQKAMVPLFSITKLTLNEPAISDFGSAQGELSSRNGMYG